MAESYVRKNGLLYSEDLQTVISVDTSSDEFSGKVPFGAKEILDEAFSGTTVQEISLPDSLKALPPCLFENLTQLTTVKLPSTIEELSPYLFSGCVSLKKVIMPEQINKLEEGVFYGCASLQDVPFKNGIQEVGENACAGCTSIRSLVIPNTVAKIGPRAFADCSSLQMVVFPAKLYELAEDAFEGCENIRTIRIDPENHLFYVNESDGCLYEKSIDGEDKLRLKVVEHSSEEPKLIDEKLDEKTDDDLLFVSSDDFEDDDTFSSEITATDEEYSSVLETENIDINKGVEVKMDNNDLDAMFADIMSDEKERTEPKADVGISDAESAVLSEVMDVMADSKSSASNAAVTTDELEKLFANHEAEVTKENAEEETNAVDSKTQILLDSVEFCKIIECSPSGEVPEDAELFVVAEKTVTDEAGNKAFTSKLEACVKKIARVQDYKKIYMLNGLPLDNDEFMQFYFHFINKRNVVLACEASSPSKLSDYCKIICEQSRISLDKNDLINQRKSSNVKNNSLIKLVVQDIY